MSLQRQLQLQLLQVVTVLQLLQLPAAVSLLPCIVECMAACNTMVSAYCVLGERVCQYID